MNMRQTHATAPGVSVLMGVYNCADTLAEALDCVVAQTYTDWELIACDDGSSDATLEVLEGYAARDHRIRVLRNERNVGLAPTLNRCLAEARAPIVARMDGDDRCSPDRFATQVDFLKAHPDFALVSTPMVLFDEAGDWGRTNPVAEPGPRDLLAGSPFAHAALAMRTSALRALGGYSERRRHWRVEDFELWVRFMRAGYRGANLPEPLYAMRNDREAASRRKFSARVNEAGVVAKIVRTFNFSPVHYAQAARPLILGMLPEPLYLALHRRRRGL
ncbi:glycosyltransferase family 2 protein [Actinomycetota bacterium]